jgi:TRAP-type C4-dicarboxylate transport system substrate-binding protein
MNKLLMTAAFAATAMWTSGAANAVTLKLAAFIPPKSVSGSRVLTPIANMIEQESKGDLKIKIYYGGQLGRSPRKQYELVTNGVADLAYIVDIYTSGQFPDTSIFELPYNIKNATEGSKARWRMYEAGHLRGYDNVKAVGLWMSEPGGIHTRKPMQALSDIKGMKIRATGRVATAYLKQFGAIPVGMPVTKVTEAIDRGVLDGLMQSWVGLVTFRTHNVVKYHYEAPVGALTFSIVLNKKQWNKLSGSQKALINKYGGKYMAAKAGNAFDTLGHERKMKHQKDKDRTFISLSPGELASARAAVQPIYDNWVKNTPDGQKKLDALQAILADIRSKK